MTDGWMDGGVQSRPGSCGAIAIRHLRIFTRGHELNSMGKTHESDGRTRTRTAERSIQTRGEKEAVTTSSSSSSSVQLSPISLHLSEYELTTTAGTTDRPAGRINPEQDRDRPGYGHMQWREEG